MHSKYIPLWSFNNFTPINFNQYYASNIDWWLKIAYKLRWWPLMHRRRKICPSKGTFRISFVINATSSPCKKMSILLLIMVILLLSLMAYPIYLFLRSPKDKYHLLEDIKWELLYLYIGTVSITEDVFRVLSNKTGELNLLYII